MKWNEINQCDLAFYLNVSTHHVVRLAHSKKTGKKKCGGGGWTSNTKLAITSLIRHFVISGCCTAVFMTAGLFRVGSPYISESLSRQGQINLSFACPANRCHYVEAEEAVICPCWHPPAAAVPTQALQICIRDIYRFLMFFSSGKLFPCFLLWSELW